MHRLQTIVYAHFRTYGRHLPWRVTRNPYHILVSEIMLQQTQVSRVLVKYPLFIQTFPTLESLARAPLGRVLAVWQGMGYNRRALLLKKCAAEIMTRFQGTMPRSPELLQALPGIGKATAGSICAFAFNKPVVFIETNIRSVYLHHFFPGKANISDEQLLPYIIKTLDERHPRKWYNALMDYGVYLKEQHANPSRRSRHYARQSRFEGSDRQVRGKILRLLLRSSMTAHAMVTILNIPQPRLTRILQGLSKDSLIRIVRSRWTLA